MCEFPHRGIVKKYKPENGGHGNICKIVDKNEELAILWNI